jgi:membrane-bound lytic murein transglycosylase B
VVVALAVALTTSLAAAGPAGATAPRERVPATVPSTAGAVIFGIDARLVGLPLDPSSGSQTSDALTAAQARSTALHREQDQLTAQQAELLLRQEEASASERAATLELAAAERRLDALAVAAYRGGSGPEIATQFGSGDLLERSRRIELASRAAKVLRDAVDRAVRARRKAGRSGRAAAKTLADTGRRLDELAAELPRADHELQARTAQARSVLPSALVSGIGIPVAALDAYLRAETTMTLLAPTCGIKWWLLAGVADGESGHGTSGGARADAGGTVYPPIVGIPLDGTNHTQAVADTDQGLLDGDATWDHAVGPMQFTPGTWRAWASDGNGDGVMDPQNLYDAALGAARKLCADAGPGGLLTDDQIARALKPYAVEARLVRAKLARAREYELQGLPAAPAAAAPAPIGPATTPAPAAG